MSGGFMGRSLRATVACAAIGLALAVAAALPVSSRAAVPLEIEQFSIQPTERTIHEAIPAGSSVENIFTDVPYAFTQAGGHPWALTTKLKFKTEEYAAKSQHLIDPTRDARDVVVDLPPGLLGDPMAVPSCSLTLVLDSAQQCPADTQVGYYTVQLEGGKELLAPIVNVTPELGQSAEFALENTTKIDTPVLTAHLVHTGQGYGFTVISNSIPLLGISSFELTFWGVPADPSHDAMRDLLCRRPERGNTLECEGGGQPAGIEPVPFLTMPTGCTSGPEQATVRADSWEEPNSYTEASATLAGATHCELLRFEPSLALHPETTLADAPTGLDVGLQVPLSETPESLATPQLRDTTVTLPEGVSISPGIVDGIQACDEFGPRGINITGPEAEEVSSLNGERQLAPGHCPNASKVGSAEAITPFLPIPVEGSVYLARPACGAAGQPACTERDAAEGRLYRLYLELGGTGALARTGIHFKVALQTHVNLRTGQLTTVTLDTPQAPFSELRIHLNGGQRAAVDTPPTCGAATTTSEFTPWSAPGIAPEGLTVAGTPDAISKSFFEVQGCAGPPALHPGFLAGTVSPQAAAFTSFTLNLAREDREQYVRGVQVHTPPGLSGVLANVPLCSEAQANDPARHGECEASKIGTTRVASGAGSHPFEIEGAIYLTGPYEGAPFGLSIVTHVVAGPFNLGYVVVRARINVDQTTSALTVTADETGPYRLPQIVFGVPLRLKRVTVNVDRPNFMFNPTSCHAQQVTAKVSGAEGAVASVSTPFASAGCKSLAFRPQFTVSTNGHTSRRAGASLDVKLSYPKNAMGADANIAKVKVSLPRQLPSFLATLQRACPAATFAANPALCPVGAIVGIARATTPLLPVGLSGPVYFVSHGGEEFPSLVIVLQGYGVRVDLTGSTFINEKTGITSSTFKTVPDVPVGTFELYLPQGRYHALAANANLCKMRSKLLMPTEFVAHNGVVLKQSTKIAVSGCTGAKTARAAQAARHGHDGRAAR
jgi:hypothetical protein